MTETEYGDHSSTYWPPGWNFDRYSKATSLELFALPEGELAKLQAGLREALGETGISKLSGYLFQLAKARAASAEDPAEQMTAALVPNWLRQWTRRHRDQPWGFVAVQTSCYDDPARWERFKEEFRRIIELPFEQDGGGGSVTDAPAAKAKYEMRWVEDPALEGASVDCLRDRYAQLRPDLAAGLSQSVFLCASAGSVDSVLAVAGTDAAPSANSAGWRPSAPYILAVSADADPGLDEGHEERDWFQPVFKVAVEVLLDEFWPVLDYDATPLRRITRNIRGAGIDGETTAAQDDQDGLEEMWWSMAPSPQRLRKRRQVIGLPLVISSSQEQ